MTTSVLDKTWGIGFGQSITRQQGRSRTSVIDDSSPVVIWKTDIESMQMHSSSFQKPILLHFYAAAESVLNSSQHGTERQVPRKVRARRTYFPSYFTRDINTHIEEEQAEQLGYIQKFIKYLHVSSRSIQEPNDFIKGLLTLTYDTSEEVIDLDREAIDVEHASVEEPFSIADAVRMLKTSEISKENLVDTIVHIEELEIPDSLLQDTKEVLYTFISQFRDTDNMKAQIAVYAAIRKLTMLLDSCDVPMMTELLDAQRTPPPKNIELELTKALVWRLTSGSTVEASDSAGLCRCLFDIANCYLSPRTLIEIEKAVIALNSVIAMALMKCESFDAILQKIYELRVQWFRELLADRAESIIQSLDRENPKQSDCIALLTKLTSNLGESSAS